MPAVYLGLIYHKVNVSLIIISITLQVWYD